MVEVRVRSYLAAGLTLTAAGVIAFAPSMVRPADVGVSASGAVSTPVELVAFNGLLSPWFDGFNTASGNATVLSQYYFRAPGAVLQQAIVNQLGYLNTVLNDPAGIGEVFETIGANLQQVIRAATLLGEFGAADLKRNMERSNDLNHQYIATSLPNFLPADLDAETKKIIGQVIQGLSSPLSGVLIGVIGPVLSPAVALLNSVQAVADAAGTDPMLALQVLAAAPARVVGAFFTGATLDLPFMTPLLAQVLPEGTTIENVSLALGGLFTPGATVRDVASDVRNNPPGGIGGSLFNSLGMKVTATLTAPNGTEVTIPLGQMSGTAVGPMGALTTLSQIVARTLGWDGTGNPLTEIKLPELDQDTPEGTSPSAAADDPRANNPISALPAPPSRLVSLEVSSSPTTEQPSTTPTKTKAAVEDTAGQEETANNPETPPSLSDSTVDSEPTHSLSDITDKPATDSVTTAKNARTELKKARESIRESVRETRNSIRDTVKNTRNTVKESVKKMTSAEKKDQTSTTDKTQTDTTSKSDTNNGPDSKKTSTSSAE